MVFLSFVRRGRPYQLPRHNRRCPAVIVQRTDSKDGSDSKAFRAWIELPHDPSGREGTHSHAVICQREVLARCELRRPDFFCYKSDPKAVRCVLGNGEHLEGARSGDHQLTWSGVGCDSAPRVVMATPPSRGSVSSDTRTVRRRTVAHVGYEVGVSPTSRSSSESNNADSGCTGRVWLCTPPLSRLSPGRTSSRVARAPTRCRGRLRVRTGSRSSSLSWSVLPLGRSEIACSGPFSAGRVTIHCQSPWPQQDPGLVHWTRFARLPRQHH
jgi:hypothetical protein